MHDWEVDRNRSAWLLAKLGWTLRNLQGAYQRYAVWELRVKDTLSLSAASPVEGPHLFLDVGAAWNFVVEPLQWKGLRIELSEDTTGIYLARFFSADQHFSGVASDPAKAICEAAIWYFRSLEGVHA